MRQREKSTGQQNMSLKNESMLIRTMFKQHRIEEGKKNEEKTEKDWSTYMIGSISVAASSIKNPLTFHPGSTE